MTGNLLRRLFKILIKSLEVFEATQFPPRSYLLRSYFSLDFFIDLVLGCVLSIPEFSSGI
jgi:hypothetical protein